MRTLEITIQRRAGNVCPVVIEVSTDDRSFPVRYEGTLSLDFGELQVAPPQTYGQILGRALFRDAIRRAFDMAQAQSDDRLHVLLSVDDEALRPLRWEQLNAPVGGDWVPLAMNQRTPFALYVPSGIDRLFPPIGRGDLRALILVASPSDLDKYSLSPFDEQEAVESIRSALSGISIEVLGTISGTVGPPTLSSLSQRIVDGSHTILHIISHSAFARDSGETVLYLANTEGRVDPVLASGFTRRLSAFRRLPHLVYLAGCDTATPDRENALGGLAQRMVRELGIPAVLGMTERISLKATHTLTQAFYGRLIVHGEVDTALAEAHAVVASRDAIETPVTALCSRLGGRPLFSMAPDRPLNPAEIHRGLDRIMGLFDVRAPSLLDDLQAHAAVIHAFRAGDAGEISAQIQRDRNAAISAVDDLSAEVLELRFEDLARGKEPPPYDARCPFVGSAAFGPEDRAFFFGRDALIGELEKRLAARPFLAVVGPSGCGKSSLVLAGLLPRLLERQPGASYRWIRPGSNPLASLEAARAELVEPDAARLSIIVVDPFEEAFTACRDVAVREQFFARLLEPVPNQVVVLTMRDDSLGNCASHHGLFAAMNNHQMRVEPLDVAGLRLATEQQAAAVNLRFEAGLIGTVVDDVADEPAAMGILQNTLHELWVQRHGRWLKAEAYQALGRAQGLVARTAEAVYAELDPPGQSLMREILLRLISLSDDGRGTRVRVPLIELFPWDRDPADCDAMVKRFVNLRLLVSSYEQRIEVELGHELILRHWPRLRMWIDESVAQLRQRDAISGAARGWADAERADDRLDHRGPRLEQAQALMEHGAVTLNALEHDYLQACLGVRKVERYPRLWSFILSKLPRVRAQAEAISAPMLRRFARYGSNPPLTASEIELGIQRLEGLLPARAPRLLPTFQSRASDLLRHLNGGKRPTALDADPQFCLALELMDRLSVEVADTQFMALARGHEPPIYDDRCPFPGLNPFQVADRVFYFGREDFRASLIARLNADRIVVLIGQSGSGKSSLVLGFLVPELQKADPGLKLEYLTPTADPMVQLKVKLSAAGGQRTLAVIDQFEELFTLCGDEDRRREFIDGVLALPARRPVVITMRSDFWNRCKDYPALHRAFEDHGVAVGPMGIDELRITMTQQAGAVGLQFEKGLVERILDDVHDEPGRMPLHQHALRELWSSRHGRWLVHDEYLAIGKVQGAFARTAQESFSKFLLGDQGRVRNIFIRLTRLGEDPAPGEARRNTRRRVAIEELVPATEDLERVVRLVAALADARLLVTSQHPTTGGKEVELAHEALIRHWSSMRDWLEERAVPELRLRESVRDAAQDWNSAGRIETMLIHRGERLRATERLAQGPDSRFNRVEIAYVQGCSRLRDSAANEQTVRQALEHALVRAQHGIAATAGLPPRHALASTGQRIEIHIHIFESEPAEDKGDDRRSYRAQVTVPDWRKYHPQSRICLDQTLLDFQSGDYEAYGRSLGEMVFATDALGPVYYDTVKQARAAGVKLRVSLQLEAPELHAHRWERLHSLLNGQCQPLVSNAETPFSRYVFTPGFEPPRPVSVRPVRILVVIADPLELEEFGLARIPVDDREALRASFENLADAAPVILETGTARPATLPELRRALAEGFQIVHFHAHGALADGVVSLFLEGDAGSVNRVTAQDIVETFAELNEHPRLVVFAACESGGHARTDGFLPLGPSMVAIGRVPAVVAMTDRVGMRTARLLADQFYRRLLAHGVVDLALNEARASIKDRWDWSVPVLFSGLPDNQIFLPAQDDPEPNHSTKRN